jgi:para-aminobenzoate synthetase / 4-amino-4-deoxychorismate lyase
VTTGPHRLAIRGDATPFETMRAERGVVLRLPAHLARLASAAASLGIPFDRDGAEAAVAARLARPDLPAVARLRLDLGRRGRFRTRLRPHQDAAPDAPPAAVVVAASRVDADHPRQRHKTTDRALYDAATRWARRHGLADVVFLNQHGRVAEGAISTVFVRIDGRLVTPPTSDGALPGVLRAELLASGAAVEAPLRAADLAGELYLGSALRGLRRVRCVEHRSPP